MHHYAEDKINEKTLHSWKQAKLCTSHSSCSLVSSRNYIYSWVCYLVFRQQRKAGKLDFNDLAAGIIRCSKYHSEGGRGLYWLTFTFFLRLSMWQLCSWLIIPFIVSFLYHNTKLSYVWSGNYKRQLKWETCPCEENDCACSFMHLTRFRMKEDSKLCVDTEISLLKWLNGQLG